MLTSHAPASITEFIVGACSHIDCIVVQGGRFQKRDFPSRAYLIESGGEKVLWDTGYSQHFLNSTRGVYRLFSLLVTPDVVLHKEDSLISQLRAHGVGPEDITALVASHFHADHVAGLADFRGVPVVASSEAWESIKGVSGVRALLQAHIPALVPDWIAENRVDLHQLPVVDLPELLSPFAKGFVLTADGNVLAVPLPGHAKGHLGCFVKTGLGWELIASDAAWDERAYTELRGPAAVAFIIQDSREEYFKTLEKLHLLHLKGVRIRLTHEPRPAAQA